MLNRRSAIKTLFGIPFLNLALFTNSHGQADMLPLKTSNKQIVTEMDGYLTINNWVLTKNDLKQL